MICGLYIIILYSVYVNLILHVLNIFNTGFYHHLLAVICCRIEIRCMLLFAINTFLILFQEFSILASDKLSKVRQNYF